MPKLSELQQDFWHAVASSPGELPEGYASRIGVAPGAVLDSSARLQVYVDAYYLRLREVLAEDFPRIAEALGDDDFDDLVRGYLARHPSTHPSLRNLGGSLADYLAARRRQPAWLSDLARLERARVDVFDAPDDRVLTLDDLRAVEPATWPELRFRAIRALTLVPVQWSVWGRWQPDAPVPQPAQALVRVWRARDDRVLHAPLQGSAAEAMARLIAGETFVGICEAFGSLPEERAPREAAALLARWVEDGIVAGFDAA